MIPETRARPRGSARHLPFVLLVGATAALATAFGIGQEHGPDALSVVRGAVAASYLAAGLFTQRQRPGGRFGDLLVLVGFAYVIASLTASDSSLAHSVGRVAHAGLVVLLVYAFLCFPNDRLSSRREQRLVSVLGVATAALWLPTLLTREQLPPAGPLVDCGEGCPDNAFRLLDVPEPLSTALSAGVIAVTSASLAALVLLLALKARAPGRLRGRMVVPLLACVGVLALNYVLYTTLRAAGVNELDVLTVVGAISALAIPPAIVFGQVHGRVFAATRLGHLVSSISAGAVTPERVEELLRDALGDPGLRLLLTEDGGRGFVDVRGEVVELPQGRRDVRVTAIARDGRTIGALVHEPAIQDRSGVNEGLGATALLLLENAGLVEELRASRSRIVAEAQRERMQLERNLHDGAQQRLFSLQLKLSNLRSRVGDGPTRDELEELAGDAAAAAAELRELAQGLYPASLRDSGLVAALRPAARAAAIPVRLDGDGLGRFPEAVEEAVYYTVLEAIQNASKHGGDAARVAVTFRQVDSRLEFRVADDGDGFEERARFDGLGLYSMRDRIGAVGGEVAIASAPGHGTTVSGSVPIA